MSCWAPTASCQVGRDQLHAEWRQQAFAAAWKPTWLWPVPPHRCLHSLLPDFMNIPAPPARLPAWPACHARLQAATGAGCRSCAGSCPSSMAAPSERSATAPQVGVCLFASLLPCWPHVGQIDKPRWQLQDPTAIAAAVASLHARFPRWLHPCSTPPFCSSAAVSASFRLQVWPCRLISIASRQTQWW